MQWVDRHAGRLLTILVLLALPACRPGVSTGEEPKTGEFSLGDRRTRSVDGMVMVYVPGGEFEMGSTDSPLEQPVHPVAVDAFWIDRAEVSNRQYQGCVEAGMCPEPRCWAGGDSIWEDSNFNGAEHPVLCVNWLEAKGYCEWVGARLPTEAEWEYAARGPEGRQYTWGDRLEGRVANFCDVNCPKNYADSAFDDGYAYTAPAGSYPDGASWCGAEDLSGNVWEWVSDWMGKYPAERQVNPKGPPSGIQHVIRGGAWDTMQVDMRSAARKGAREYFELSYLGFRCAASASQ